MKNKLTSPASSSCDRQEDSLASPIDFESCVNVLGGNRTMLHDLVLEFSGHLDIQLKDLAAAFAAADSDVVCRVAHSIKGGAAVLSAHSLMNVAAAIEEFGKSGDLPKSEDCFPKLEKEVARLRCYCEELMNSDA